MLLLLLGLSGALAAALPLYLVFRLSAGDRYRKLVRVALCMTFELIMFGAFTRLTDSGLGCPDWPGCYGQANPLQAHAEIRSAELAMPHGPVTLTKAWIEMIHRFLAMGIGLLLIVLALLAWQRWQRAVKANLPRESLWLPSLLVILVCIQGAFGAFTVTLKLQPLIVTLHLLFGMVLLAMLAWLDARQTPIEIDAVMPSHRLVWLISFAIALLTLQIALGGWVSTNYAALACSDFPRCHGDWLPPMDFGHGFSLWRELGKTTGGEYLPFSALTAIHWTHRNFAWLAAAVIAMAAFNARKIPALRKLANAALAILVLQLILGLATIFLRWPLAIAVLHNGGAALLLMWLVMLDCKAFSAARARALRSSIPLPAVHF